MNFFSDTFKNLHSLSNVGVQKSVFWIILVGIICFTITTIVGKCKGEKSIFSEIIEFFKDLVGYTYGEKDGKLFQKMNFGLFTILGIASLAFLTLFFWACLKNKELMEVSAIGLISSGLILCVMTPLCMIFTRHYG